MAVQGAPVTRSVNYGVVAQVALLTGTAVLLIIKYLRGQLDLYIHPRYTPLVLVAALVLGLMAFVRLRAVFDTTRTGLNMGVYALLALPLLLGTFVPSQPLGADTLSGRGMQPLSAQRQGSWKPVAESDSTQWSLLDWTTALTSEPEAYAGRPVDVIGFVYRDDTLGPDAFYAVRYVVTCCSADGNGVGLPVVWQGGSSLPNDSWVRVVGTLGSSEVNGTAQPAIVASAVEPVPEPESPYLYP